ncbi:MAG: hypothetical protein VYA27_11495, partial [Verrucomicrobiota bacterium]|nr:hypothetical protein [Verrucomicrobiota bacterium]
MAWITGDRGAEFKVFFLMKQLAIVVFKQAGRMVSIPETVAMQRPWPRLPAHHPPPQPGRCHA